MLSKFFPKEFNFFEFFDKQALNLVDAAACFREIVAQPEVSEESQRKMKEIEREGILTLRRDALERFVDEFRH